MYSVNVATAVPTQTMATAINPTVVCGMCQFMVAKAATTKIAVEK
jgi:hypothetical protein